ncbi:pickpocket protein 11 [Scaptodrosophila lebanonensis]|uniref:Pickpocket protein 11 n=1 Tax=Drosophila lebanonensis TaxID=7225 RepID=A0A6J2TP68_DROLE|nr:pickpocket protein 11 [Scaptodrosophila lebanonensis]
MPLPKRRIFDLQEVQAQQLAKSFGSNTKDKRSPSQVTLTPWVAFKRWFSENLSNYCQTTSLHGFSYITRPDISHGERLFWLGIVILAIITSIVLVLISWYWNRETPTVTVIESSHFPTWNIPFPAITVCNFNKISKTKALNFLDRMQLPSNVTKMDLRDLFNLTLYPPTLVVSNESLQIYDRILKLNNVTLADLAQQISPDCIEMISRCIWKGMNTRCESLFQRVVTMEGTCCSFNYFASVTNNFPEKIAYQVPKRPYRVTGCGYPTGLSILLNPMISDYYGTFFSGYGFRLLIHDAYNFPDENSETKVVTATRESFVRISPESTYATEDIRRMDLQLRNCLFGRERSLNGLQRYSFVNCMFECRVLMILKRCGCLPAYMHNNGSQPTCGILQVNCVIQSKRVFSMALANINITLSIVRQTDDFPCDCLPDCQSNHYVSESTMGKLNITYSLTRMTASNRTDNILLHVFYSDLMSTRYRMEIFQNWLSALASFGGLLGLIMGFSIVTAFEFIYFLTFRPIFNFVNQD